MDREAPRRFLVVSFRRFIFSGGPVPRLSKIAALSETKNLLYLATSLLALGGILLAIKRRMHAVFLFSRLVVIYSVVYYIIFPRNLTSGNPSVRSC